jgi:hypothetical protein
VLLPQALKLLLLGCELVLELRYLLQGVLSLERIIIINGLMAVDGYPIGLDELE